MADEIIGEEPKEEELETPSEPSTEETKPVDESTDESTEEEEPTIPLSRLRKEKAKTSVLKGDIDSLKEQMKELAKDKTVTGTEEGKAKDYLQNMINGILDARDSKISSEKKAKDAVLDEALGEIKEIYPKIDEKKFLDFVEKGKFEDSTNGLWGAAKIFAEFQKSKGETIEKPKMPTGKKTTDKVKSTPVDLAKDLNTIVQEAKEEGKATGQI